MNSVFYISCISCLINLSLVQARGFSNPYSVTKQIKEGNNLPLAEASNQLKAEYTYLGNNDFQQNLEKNVNHKEFPIKIRRKRQILRLYNYLSTLIIYYSLVKTVINWLFPKSTHNVDINATTPIPHYTLAF